MDRLGDVIRRRGENISSYQVEDVINQHVLISMSAAFPIPADEGDEDEIAVFVVAKETRLTQDELLQWVERTIPSFMKPKYLRLIDDLPRTPTNKIEKFKLKKQLLKELESRADKER
ncbi:AMP-binding enzyme [Desertibacillus haloalkaliphilus]|uniref:AMP-binding enzyme n=1 Tax=Desertibacillus haloalkaliphilus TaxID=1328930 RepID=UPI001C2584EE|nr:hypothetical protein [Desertibacillus haloalkaliphilus]MBU8906947.1 hypothetical protein [Desertibacillus haloalkaliphilus]